MGEWMGKIVTCDRCGREVRRELIDTTELDGGFTRTNRYVDMPDTWKYHHEIGWLCPDCDAEYESLIRAFIGGSEEK